MLQPAARRACIHERVREWEGMKGCRQCYAHCPHHTARTSLLMYTILGSPGTLSRRHVSAPAEATDPSPEVLVWQWPTVTVPTLRWASQPSLDLPTLTMVVLTCSSHSTASAAAAPCTREYRAGPAVGAQPAAANRGEHAARLRLPQSRSLRCHQQRQLCTAGDPYCRPASRGPGPSCP